MKSVHYENYDDCLNNKLPVKRLIKGENSRIEESCRGHIEYRRYLIPKKYLTYDTRHFHKVLYGIPAPKKIKKTRRSEV